MQALVYIVATDQDNIQASLDTNLPTLAQRMTVANCSLGLRVMNSISQFLLLAASVVLALRYH
jgi:hypothetical protein